MSDVIDNLSGGAILDDVGPDGERYLIACVNNPEELREYAIFPGSEAPSLRAVYTLSGFDDVEGVGIIDGRRVVVTEERRGNLVVIELPNRLGTGLVLRHTIQYSEGTVISARFPGFVEGNSGIEGVTYNAAAGCFYTVNEKNPRRVLQIDGTTHDITDLFSPENMDASDLAGLAYSPMLDQLVFISHQSKRILRTTLSGTVLDWMPVAGSQAEGIALYPDLSCFLAISEPNEIYKYCRPLPPSPPYLPPSPPLSCNETWWPDKKDELVCGECKVLVDNFRSTYLTCDGYCAAVGLSCTGAWEEADDDCNEESVETCSSALDTTDAICECRDVAPPSPPASPPAPPFLPGQCDESLWPHKDHGLVCGECKVLVDEFDDIYGNCDGYCNNIGRSCTGAWEEDDDTCTVLYSMTCEYIARLKRRHLRVWGSIAAAHATLAAAALPVNTAALPYDTPRPSPLTSPARAPSSAHAAAL